MQSLLDAPAKSLHPMDGELSKLFMKCCSKDRKDMQPFHRRIRKQNICNNFKAYLLYVFTQRVLMWSGCVVSVAVVIFLMQVICSSRDAILWAFTLHIMFQKKQRIISMNDIVKEFRFGFPSDKAIAILWEANRDILEKRDNWSDSNYCWKSKDKRL